MGEVSSGISGLHPLSHEQGTLYPLPPGCTQLPPRPPSVLCPTRQQDPLGQWKQSHDLLTYKQLLPLLCLQHSCSPWRGSWEG